MENIKVSDQQKAAIIRKMEVGFIKCAEFREMLGARTDAGARGWLAREVKPFYPIICSSARRGYKIATTPEDLEFAKACSRENHRKAATLHRNTNVLDKWIIKEECQGALSGTIPFKDEIEKIKANV